MAATAGEAPYWFIQIVSQALSIYNLFCRLYLIIGIINHSHITVLPGLILFIYILAGQIISRITSVHTAIIEINV